MDCRTRETHEPVNAVHFMAGRDTDVACAACADHLMHQLGPAHHHHHHHHHQS